MARAAPVGAERRRQAMAPAPGLAAQGIFRFFASPCIFAYGLKSEKSLNEAQGILRRQPLLGG
jgi:hypothetical protein